MDLKDIYEDSLIEEYNSNNLSSNYIKSDLVADELSSIFQKDSRRYPHSLEVNIWALLRWSTKTIRGNITQKR